MDSVGGFDGKLINDPTWTTQAAVQGGLRLDVGQYVEIKDETALQLPKELSVAGWIKPPDTSGFRVLLSKGEGSEQNFWLGLNGPVPTVVVHDGSYRMIAAPAFVSAGDWHHLAYTYRADDLLNIYLNGALVHSEPAGGELTTSNKDVLLGNSASSGYVRAEIDDVMLFGTALTADDINLLYREGSTAATAASSTPACSGETYRDTFATISYAGSSGSLDWSDAWFEIGESDGASSGDERVMSVGGANLAVRVRDNNNGGEGVGRRVDLSGYSSATLRFDYARINLPADEYVAILVDSSSGQQEIGRIEYSSGSGNDLPTNMLSAVYPLDDYIGEAITFSFVTTSGMPNQSGTYIDNVTVEGCAP